MTLHFAKKLVVYGQVGLFYYTHSSHNGPFKDFVYDSELLHEIIPQRICNVTWQIKSLKNSVETPRKIIPIWLTYKNVKLQIKCYFCRYIYEDHNDYNIFIKFLVNSVFINKHN